MPRRRSGGSPQSLCRSPPASRYRRCPAPVAGSACIPCRHHHRVLPHARCTKGNSDQGRRAPRRTARRRASRISPACRCRDGCRCPAPRRARRRATQPLGRQRGVVQVAVPAGARRKRMMSGRARQRVGVAPSGGFSAAAVAPAAAASADAQVPAPIGQAASAVYQPACPTVPAGRLPPMAEHFGCGMNGRHDLRPGIRKRCPRRVRPGEVIEIIGRVHHLQQGSADGRCCRDVQPGVPAARQQRLSPRRGLEIGPHPAALQKECRRVAELIGSQKARIRAKRR